MKRVFLILLSVFLCNVYKANAQVDDVISLMKTKSILSMLQNLGIDNSKNKELVISTLDSLLLQEKNEESLKLLSDYKKEIINREPSFKESKELDVLTKEDLKGFYLKEDKFNNIFFVLPNTRHKFRVYLVKTNEGVGLRLITEFKGDDWIFFDRVLVMTGENKYEYEDIDTKTEVEDWGVEEKSDLLVNSYLLKMLENIVNQGEASIRFVGKQYYRDTKLSRSEINAISKALKMYYKLTLLD